MKMKLLAALLTLGIAQSAFADLRSATAISTPSGEGQKVTLVALKYDETLRNRQLKQQDFSVTGRKITGIYLTNQIDANAKARPSGKIVMLRLDPNDADAATTQKGATREDFSSEREIKLTVTQRNPIRTNHKTLPKKSVVSSQLIHSVVDDFKQFSFTDPATGIVVPYNLYIPKNYNPKKRYPLVMFIHDAGSSNHHVRYTLLQGNGATSFASPQAQAKHQAFVLAPQFDHKITNDNSDDPEDLNPTINLIKSLFNQYNIDKNRVYTTGQSGGAMMSIAMNIAYPDFFAASYLVAGQWEPSKTPPMAKNNLFVFVSENDPKAFPIESEIMKVLAAHGAMVKESHGWNAQLPISQLNQNVKMLLAQGGNVHFASLKGGTLKMEQEQPNHKGAAHLGTWQIAYNIPAIRDWLFNQKKK